VEQQQSRVLSIPAGHDRFVDGLEIGFRILGIVTIRREDGYQETCISEGDGRRNCIIADSTEC
jgi:hypothetical protein